MAVKILKKNNPNLDSTFLELVMTEARAMSTLSDHLNVLKMIEFGREGIVEKSDGR